MLNPKLLITAAGISMASMLIAQDTAIVPKIVKDHYTVSGGLLGGVNYSQLRIGDNNGFIESDGWKWNGAGGVWLNLPIGRVFSIEPQALYSVVGGKVKTPSPNGNLDQTLRYISVPVNLKLSFGNGFAFFVGPQFDFLSGAKNKNTDSDNKNAFQSNDIGINGGIEIFPHGRATIYARYMHGLKNINKVSSPEYFNQGIQAGLKLKLFGRHVDADSDGDGIIDKEDACANVFGLARYKGCPIPDTDNDGINDEMDKCVSVAGLERYQGCPIPDTDNDGINDEIDKCPSVPGLPRYDGCPIPDTDKDGVNDEEDKCPTVPGLAKYQGCPIPDTDGDGINDEEDQCPNTPGVPEMKGCPKIAEFEAYNVTFQSGKSILTPNGKKALDLVVNFMKNDGAKANVLLVGHTDITGSDKINDPLSVARANAAKDYIVSQGIDENRIRTDGKGSHEPIADNKTAAGRQQNRRVEVSIQ